LYTVNENKDERWKLTRKKLLLKSHSLGTESFLFPVHVKPLSRVTLDLSHTHYNNV